MFLIAMIPLRRWMAVVCELHSRGIVRDPHAEYLRAIRPYVHRSVGFGERIVQLETEAYEIAGQPFNLASPKQLGEIFFDKLGLPVIKKTAKIGRASCRERVSSPV